MNHVTHMNESCLTYEWVMSHIWMSHVTHMNESRLTYEWVTSHIWMRHVSHMNESCHTYECVTTRIWMRHVLHTSESCLTYKCVVSRTSMSHVSILQCHIAQNAHARVISRTRRSRARTNTYTKGFSAKRSLIVLVCLNPGADLKMCSFSAFWVLK